MKNFNRKIKNFRGARGEKNFGWEKKFNRRKKISEGLAYFYFFFTNSDTVLLGKNTSIVSKKK